MENQRETELEEEDEIELLVNKAVDLIRRGDSSLESHKKLQRISYLVLKKLRIKLDDFRISRLRFKNEFLEYLENIKDANNPGSKFTENKEDFIDRLRSIDLKEFKIIFPLNFKLNLDRSIEKFEVLDYNIRRVSLCKWEEKYEPYLSKECQSFLKRNKVSLPSFSLWELSLKSRDVKYAVEEVSRTIELLLGKLNYICYYEKTNLLPQSISGYRKFSKVRNPYIYFVFEGEDFESYLRTKDTERDIVSLPGVGKKKSFNSTFPQLKHLDRSSDIESNLVSGIRFFQRGMVSSNLNKAFMNFWRSLEILTLIGKNSRTREVLERAASVSVPEDEKTFNLRLEILSNKRNKIVHKNIDERATVMDINLVKTLSVNLIKIYFDLLESKSSFAEKEYRYLLNTGSDGFRGCSKEELIQKKAGLENSIRDLKDKKEVLKVLINSKDE